MYILHYLAEMRMSKTSDLLAKLYLEAIRTRMELLPLMHAVARAVGRLSVSGFAPNAQHNLLL